MPKRYRASSRRSSLPAPIAALAKSAAAQYRRDQAIDNITAASSYFNEGINLAGTNVQTRYDYNSARGQGAYKLGRAVSRFGRGKFGQALQSAATQRAVGMISGQGMYTGHGAYEGTMGNELIPGKSDLAMVPNFSSSGDETGSLTISHKEYICDIYGPSTPFNCQSYAINPGLEQSFPWLSQIAQNYDEYTIHQLIYTFRSTTTDIGSNTNGQCGTVVMGTNYNAAAAPWRDKVTMMEYDAVMSGKATDSLLHGVECDPNKLSGADGKYIRANPVSAGQDPKTYDHGLFQLAVSNSPAGYVNNSIGELWVSYTVELRKPKFFTARGLGISQDIFVSGNGSEDYKFTLGSQAAMLRGQANNINCQITVTSGVIVITFPAAYSGYLLVSHLFEGVLVTPATYTLSSTGNVIGVNDIYGGYSPSVPGDSPVAVIWAATANQSTFLTHVLVGIATGGVDNTLTLTVPLGNTSTVSQGQLKIQEYNSGFSYRSANLGTSDAPILVNASGIVVVP
jgi:hypothetical protein